MTTDQLIDYYVALLIMQYATKDKARATIAAYVAQALQDQIISQVQEAFNFATSPIGPQLNVSAQGAQLEAVASYRGAQRVYFGLPSNNFFQMAEATDTIPPDGWNGFMDALSPVTDVTWLFATVEDTRRPLYSLTDDQLYRLTQLRAQVQSDFFSIADIDAIMETFFANNVAMLDNLNMTMLYVHLASDLDPFFTIAAVSQSLPKPAGVRIEAITADLLTDFYGLQDELTGYDASFSGFSDALDPLTTGTFITAP